MIAAVDVYTDGGARGNPGPSASGVVVFSDQGNVIYKSGRFLGSLTNNQAEYQAILDALTWAMLNQDKSIQHFHFHLDSLLIVKQLNQEYKVKTPHLKPLHQLATQFVSAINSKVTFSHVPREKNQQADAVVNQILDSISPTLLY